MELSIDSKSGVPFTLTGPLNSFLVTGIHGIEVLTDRGTYRGAYMDISVGDRATRSLTLTAEHVEGFAELSGDRNPLHFDEDFAAATPFGRLVVQGGLTTGLLHALVAMDLPGPGTVFMNQEWKFTAPVFIDDTITAEAEVLNRHDTKPVTTLGITVRRQDGETVLEGEAVCYTFGGPQ